MQERKNSGVIQFPAHRTIRSDTPLKDVQRMVRQHVLGLYKGRAGELYSLMSQLVMADKNGSVGDMLNVLDRSTAISAVNEFSVEDVRGKVFAAFVGDKEYWTGVAGKWVQQKNRKSKLDLF